MAILTSRSVWKEFPSVDTRGIWDAFLHKSLMPKLSTAHIPVELSRTVKKPPIIHVYFGTAINPTKQWQSFITTISSSERERNSFLPDFPACYPSAKKRRNGCHPEPSAREGEKAVIGENDSRCSNAAALPCVDPADNAANASREPRLIELSFRSSIFRVFSVLPPFLCERLGEKLMRVAFV